MSLIHSKIGQGSRIRFEKVLKEYGRSDLIEEEAPNVYMNRELKSEEIHSVNDVEQCLEKENQQSGYEYGRAVCS